MRILITGATGFIGSHLVRHLVKKHTIFALTRNPLPLQPLANVHWIEQDLTQPLDTARLPERVDAVIHLAQSKFYRQFPDKASDIFDVNIRSTFQLLDYALRAGVQKFISASSGGIYGYSYEKLVETDPVNPLNFYLSSKYTAELLIASYQPFFHTVVLRFFFVYGCGQRGMLIPNLLRKVQAGETITIEGNPGLRINPIYVQDAIRVFEPTLHLPGPDLFNVAGDEVVTITDLVRLMEKASGRAAVIRYTETSTNGDLVGDNTRMKKVLGVYPQTTLVEGLREMAQPGLAVRGRE